MQTIKEVFARNIEEDIAPVIYFHTIDPETAAREVGEYVFTSRSRDEAWKIGGIHEQMVDLLNNLYAAITNGNSLPASWISGFFGSGKSSFAKLLGLALDGMAIPKKDGQGRVIGEWTMDEALIARDDTKNADQLAAAFARLKSVVSPMAVIFDIGTMAKNNESIPHTVYRQILSKLGYSSLDGVAHFEIALEDEGRFAEFVEKYRAEYKLDWADKKNGGLAPQQFRSVYQSMFPSQTELLEVATFKASSLNIKTMVDDLARVMERRAPGKTVFIVVDEVSQYISKDHQKMLDLQSFVSEIGGRAKPLSSRLWLLVTGQEKLEEESRESVLFKLQDRFPPALRVHLDRANVSEVVERRLLKKKAGSALEALVTGAHLDLLRLHAYGCADLKREQLLDDYPLLPAHIPLFMDITQSIRNTSLRTQSDSGGVRSVLNNIWDLFNNAPVVLKDRPLGTLLTLDMLYDMIGSSIDGDVLLTLHRIFEKHAEPSMERKVVKAIALLELNGDAESVTIGLLASLLYPSLGAAPVTGAVEAAVETLRKENWIQYAEKGGWNIQNNAAQEWNRQKAEISVSAPEVDELLRKLQGEIVEPAAQPVYPRANVRFPLVCWWGSDRSEDRFSGKGEATSVDVCFHWVTNPGRREQQNEWLELCRSKNKAIHWVSGDTNNVEALARDYRRSQKIIARYRGQGNLQPIQSRLWIMEQGEADRNYESLKKELRQVWLEGYLYFDGSRDAALSGGTTFEAALKGGVEARIVKLYHKFESGNIHIIESDFRQLFDKDTAGLSSIFLNGAGGLGLAYADGGKIQFRPSGAVPSAIFQFIQERSFVTGEQLVAQFSTAPFGYSKAVIKASVIGLLRAEKVKLGVITSIRDPDARKMFEADREFGRAEIEARINPEGDIGPRDKVAMRTFFDEKLGVANLESSSESIADALFDRFPKLKDQVGEIRMRLASLGLTLPSSIEDLNRALTECLSSRLVEGSLHRLKLNMTVLESGYPRLVQVSEALSDTTIRELRTLKSCLEVETVQLREIDSLDPVSESVAVLESQFAQTEPWKGYADAKPSAEAIRSHYRSSREHAASEQKETFDEINARIKSRTEFAHLDTAGQNEVLSLVSQSFQDIDIEAVQPTLVYLSRLCGMLKEAEARAHRRMEQLAVRKGDDKPIQALKSGLRNRVVGDEAELDRVLSDLRGRCARVLASGEKVRFEE